MESMACNSYVDLRTNVIAPADVSGHLPGVFYISCEYFDNSLKALKGIQDVSKRKIIAIFQLAKPSHLSGRVCCDACHWKAKSVTTIQ